MKFQLYCLLMILIFLAPLTATAAPPIYRGSCAISFQAQKTIIKDFSGTAACEPFEITVTDGMVRITVIAARVATMDTGHSKRDMDMRTMFKYEVFPLITAETEAFASDRFFTTAGTLVEMPEELTFALTIRDVTQTITATVTEHHIDSSSIEATLAFDLSLSSFELDPPSFMGIVRVKDRLQVEVIVSLDVNPPIPPVQE